jgi:hypothetical protein
MSSPWLLLPLLLLLLFHTSLLQADSEMDGNRRIWGTAYTQAEMTAAIRRFLVTFHAEAEEAQQGEQQQPAPAGMATYVGLLRQVRI